MRVNFFCPPAVANGLPFTLPMLGTETKLLGPGIEEEGGAPKLPILDAGAAFPKLNDGGAFD